MSRNLTASQKQRVKQLCSFTGASPAQAATILQHANWSIEAAADAFFTYGYQLDAGAASASQQPQQPRVDEAAINRWFDKYADPEEPDSILDEGIEQFCNDLQVDTQDPVVLGVAWRMGAATMCVFTRAEWTAGMARLGADSPEALRKSLPELREEITGPSFKEFYMFCYDFGKEEGKKSLNHEMALALWDLIMKPRNYPLYETWVEFIKTQEAAYPYIPKDTWSLLGDFLQQVDAELNGYDEADAWPVAIDDFVAFVQDKNESRPK